MKLIRGGSWDDNPNTPWRASYRTYGDPSGRYDFIGFRCVRGGSPEDQKIRGRPRFVVRRVSVERPTYRSYEPRTPDRYGLIGFRCVRRLA